MPTDIASLPGVRDRPGDLIHAAAQRIALQLAAAPMDSPELRAMLAKLPAGIQRQALLAIAHEFIWEVMEGLAEARAVERPAALKLEHPSEKQLRELMFQVAR